VTLPRPEFFTQAERNEFTRATPMPHQKAAVLLILARNLEQALAKDYDVDLQLRETGGFTLTVDMPAPVTREDVVIPGAQARLDQ
jgi:hypothetical protein